MAERDAPAARLGEPAQGGGNAAAVGAQAELFFGSRAANNPLAGLLQPK